MRAAFHFFINLAHIFPDDAQSQQDRTTNEPHGNQKRRPTGYRVSLAINHDAIDNGHHGYQDEQETEHGNVAKRTDGKRSDAIQSETDHLTKRIFRLAGHALLAVVINQCRRKAARPACPSGGNRRGYRPLHHPMRSSTDRKPVPCVS